MVIVPKLFEIMCRRASQSNSIEMDFWDNKRHWIQLMCVFTLANERERVSRLILLNFFWDVIIINCDDNNMHVLQNERVKQIVKNNNEIPNVICEGIQVSCWMVAFFLKEIKKKIHYNLDILHMESSF